MDFAQLQQFGKENGVVITDEMLRQLEIYMDLLISWNEKFNLTAVSQPEEIIERHFCDCIVPLTVFDIAGSVADVGSGAGFPGLVWKIVRPDLEMTLIEPTGKRCTFLNEVIRRLDLQKIRVVNERSEEHVKEHREAYDIVTARAVANLRVLLELCLPLVRTRGAFIAMKGNRGEEELQESANAMKTLGGRTEGVETASVGGRETGMNILIRKEHPTPVRYPRNYGQIKKKPL